jgi:hypothetical protein
MLFRVSIADQFLFTVPRHDSGRSAPPPVGPARLRPFAPRPRAKPRADSRPGWRGLNRGVTHRGPQATRTPRNRASDPKPAGAARGACVVAARARRHRSPRTRPRTPRHPHRHHVTGPRPDRDCSVPSPRHRHGARFRSHTPPDPRGPCRTLTLYDCTTDRHTQHRHTALRSQSAPPPGRMTTELSSNHLAVLARFNRPTACSTHRHRIGASGLNAHLGHSLCSHGSRLERWWLFFPLSSPTHGSD